MPRVKRGKVRQKKRAAILKQTKGFRWGRKKLIKLAKTAILKSGQHSYIDRKKKKRVNRRLWNLSINAGAREHGMTYSTFISALKKKGSTLDRKVLSGLAKDHPTIFEKIVGFVK